MTEEGQSGLDKSWIPFGGGARKCMGYNFAIMEIKVSPSLHIGCCLLAQAQLTWHDSTKRSYMHYTTPCVKGERTLCCTLFAQADPVCEVILLSKYRQIYHKPVEHAAQECAEYPTVLFFALICLCLQAETVHMADLHIWLKEMSCQASCNMPTMHSQQCHACLDTYVAAVCTVS